MQLSEVLAITYWACVGTFVGSFINVIAWRLPRGDSLWRDSACPGCNTGICWSEKLPLVSYLILKGRCRHCARKIPARYLGAELLGGAAFAAVAIQARVDFASPSGWIEVVAWAIWAAMLLAAALVDAQAQVIPEGITRAGILLGLVWRTLGALIITGSTEAGTIGLMDALYGLVLALGVFDTLAWIGQKMFKREAIGGGDAKLAAVIGVWLGWKLFLLALAAGLLIGGLYAIAGLGMGKLKPGDAFALGPALAAGAVLAAVIGPILLL